MSEDLARLLADLKEEEAIGFVKEALEQGADPLDLLEGAKEGMNIVGRRFSESYYFIPDLVFSGEIMKRIVAILEPHLKRDNREGEDERLGKVIIGTVAGDIHDIGKDLVSFMLDVNGFEVFDLGIDVPAEKVRGYDQGDRQQRCGTERISDSGFSSHERHD